MIESIEWLRLLIFNHRSLEYVIIFFGAAFGGEFALFILGFLAAQNVVSIFPLIILGFAGAFLPNILWFLLGKTTIASKVILHRYASTTTLIITQAVSKMSKGNHFMAFTIIKFLIGTPFILIMYINKTGLWFRQFILYETPAILLSIVVVVSIGFISGLGFNYLADLFQNLYTAIGFILFIIILMIIIQLWLKKALTNMLE